jgi:hypothetical protein
MKQTCIVAGFLTGLHWVHHNERERGWPPVTHARFDAQNGPSGAYLVAGEEVAQKIRRHSEALGGISRLTFQMVNTGLPHEKLMQSIKLIGKKVAPLVNG